MIIDRRKIYCALRYYGLHTKYRTKRELLNLSESDEKKIKSTILKIKDEKESFFAKNYFLLILTFINYYKKMEI
jgi:hypothetical protein